MEMLLENQAGVVPRVSLLLLDWSCRESFHILDYLQDQTVPRQDYEILWIEYYSRRAAPIDQALEECRRRGEPPCVDLWIRLNMLDSVCYHKHLMYNVGIAKSRGGIVVICDSDVMVRRTFVESISRFFEGHQGAVLHLDEVRNIHRRYYPFNRPSFEEVTGPGCINWRGGKTAGLSDEVDPLHSRNYGACMAARREDLIRIGGADQHRDYLGHVCGPYEMTFRLVNSGLVEAWHPREFLYHTWHPGTDGRNNHRGPHDGWNMSSTALDIRRSGRVYPLVENPVVARLRGGNLNGDGLRWREILPPEEEIRRWSLRSLRWHERVAAWRSFPSWGSPQRRGAWGFHIAVGARLLWILLMVMVKQVYFKSRQAAQGRPEVMRKSRWDKVQTALAFLGRIWKNNLYNLRVCNRILRRLAQKGVREIAIYGDTPAGEMLQTLAQLWPFQVVGIYDASRLGALRGYGGEVILAYFTQIPRQLAVLEGEGGISRDRIVTIQ